MHLVAKKILISKTPPVVTVTALDGTNMEFTGADNYGKVLMAKEEYLKDMPAVKPALIDGKGNTIYIQFDAGTNFD